MTLPCSLVCFTSVCARFFQLKSHWGLMHQLSALRCFQGFVPNTIAAAVALTQAKTLIDGGNVISQHFNCAPQKASERIPDWPAEGP